ncbi:MAG: hypothetical protein R8N23_12385 [Reichenbachiella sp.]|uniref:hypothetical protein n=1 Tax=Reichenbachiella sp. TaxID=2184521 RepID=UPI002966B143|nr:hypothetical protein [Reichenbachiella sp.]MDW3210664.1 hypothetical protein [Reichenbachiella sp.]
MYQSQWLRFLSSGYVLIALLLTLVSCIKQESVENTQDQKMETAETKIDSVASKPDSTSVAK